MNGRFPEPGIEPGETRDPTWPAGAEHSGPSVAGRRVRWFVWAAGVAAFVAFIVLGRVHTRLGVEAPVWDKHGREYVWRVWWRARHQFVSFGPESAVTAVYVGLGLVFVALCIIAVWLALVPEDRSSHQEDDMSSGSVASR